jgi:hypothetical protein
VEIDNLRTAFEWALKSHQETLALRLAGRLGRYWRVGRRAQEGVDWLSAALEAAQHDAGCADRARASVALATALSITEKTELARSSCEQGLKLARQCADHELIAEGLMLLSELARAENDYLKVRALANEALRHAGEARNESLIALALVARANTLPPGATAQQEYARAAAALRRVGNNWDLLSLNVSAAYGAIVYGDYAQATEFLDGMRELATELQDAWGLLLVFGNLGLARLFTGNRHDARVAFAEQLLVCRDNGIHGPASEGLAGLAALAVDDAEIELAARLLGAARTMGPIGHPNVEAKLEQDFYERARVEAGLPVWARAVEAGSSLAFEDALTLAISYAVQRRR